MSEPQEDEERLSDLVAAVRERRAEATASCPVCSLWRLRAGELREGMHVSTCPVRSVSRFPRPTEASR